MTPKAADWKRVARYVTTRRAELSRIEGDDLTQVKLAIRAGIGKSTIEAIEGHKRTAYWSKNLRGIETALGWAYGSIEDIAAGLEPTPIEASADAPDADTNGRIERILTGIERVSGTVADLAETIGATQTDVKRLRGEVRSLRQRVDRLDPPAR